jgi:hypothetical protein
MKRSEINACLRHADDFLRRFRFALPPFAYWTMKDWQARGSEVGLIIERRLGWDVTDFGSGEFSRRGLCAFTLRNSQSYAEKLMHVAVDQVTPLHFHWQKIEDIINRGGGTLVVKLYNSTADEDRDEKSEVSVRVDGVDRVMRAGGVVRLDPGESITLTPRLYHEFWGEEEDVLVGEVSSLNDDAHDNRFLQLAGRFPAIEEDELPLYLLVGDYERRLTAP